MPTIQLDHLSEAERRAFLIADNKIALNATWDLERLGAELLDLSELEFDLTLTGFSLAECDEVIQLQEASTHSSSELTTDNDVPRVPEKATTRLGDRFKLGHHYLLCGDARSKADVRLLMQEQKSDLLFTDPPYNVPINGHVSGLGKTKHREFTMGSGEMSNAQFIAFLKSALGVAASVSKNGALAYVCMDWRGMLPLLTAGQKVFTEFKQLCVWNKSNAGMGTFYRSKHELVFIFKNGKAPHTNTFGLGKTGRYRTNVWDYPGISSMSGHRSEDIARHQTPKPVAMVKDAILDCTRRGDIVLDPFAGSGTTLVAAHSCGRSARLLELDPLYCDVIIERFQRYTGQAAVLTTSGQSFEDVQADRLASSKQVPA